MKFYTINIPVTVFDEETSIHNGVVRIDLTMGDAAVPQDAVDKLGALLMERLNTVDLGDDE